MTDHRDDTGNWQLTDADDYEEISSDEVDRVVAALETLSETVESENIRYLLTNALLEIHHLVYDAADGEGLADAA